MFRRHNSTFVLPIKTIKDVSKKGTSASKSKCKPPTIPPEELAKQRVRRIEKAERDERMDIGMCLSPVKTYMGGFTRPKDLRVTNWMPGGQYIRKAKLYENPTPTAYTPHTVFLVQSRYSIKYGLGRAHAPEFLVGYVAANQFQKYLRQINSGWASGELLEMMDNACWPGIGPPLTPKRTKWWDSGESPIGIREAALKGPDNRGTTVELETTSSDTVAIGNGEEQNQIGLEEALVESEEYDSDDDDLLADLAHIEEARLERRRKKVELKRMGASAIATSHLNSVPFNPAKVLFDLKVKKRPVTLTTQQVSYLANKEKLRHYTRYLSHIPTTDTQPMTPKHPGYDEKLQDPAFVETVLAGTSYEYRKKYIPKLAEQPFWIPVLAITFPTRPLARTVARFAKALPRGLPYQASMPQEDLKCKYSLASRMLNLRLVRMRRLAMQTAERLSGYFGGFPGLRYNPSMPGRGVNGTLLDAPPTDAQQRVVALVADWYIHAQDEIEAYKSEGRISIPAGLIDERGNALDSALSVEESTNDGLVTLEDQGEDDSSSDDE